DGRARARFADQDEILGDRQVLEIGPGPDVDRVAVVCGVDRLLDLAERSRRRSRPARTVRVVDVDVPVVREEGARRRRREPGREGPGEGTTQDPHGDLLQELDEAYAPKEIGDAASCGGAQSMVLASPLPAVQRRAPNQNVTERSFPCDEEETPRAAGVSCTSIAASAP